VDSTLSDRYFTYKTLSNEHILEKVRGVIHVGANYGQEREVYARHMVSVMWIEPSDPIYSEMFENIRIFTTQFAFRFLAWDADLSLVPFHRTNNEGQSSSAFELSKHRELWPEVEERDVALVKATRLDTLFAELILDPREFDFLVIDAQGAELKVLKGAEGILCGIKFIQVETTDCELYKGCAQLSEIEAFMREHDFKEIERTEFSPRPDIGHCYELLYEKI
jgi:FkbM family methyltransferase